jgi:hypothetical protein
MFKHNITIAFRNLWKYKSQTLVSVIGLAVGFACFAIATLWIRYEMTFDNFHKNADRMYCVYQPRDMVNKQIVRVGPCPLAGYLKETFPEIAHATAIRESYGGTVIEVEGVEQTVDIIKIDTSFFSMFNVRLIEGSMDFLLTGDKKLAITREKSLQLFGDKNPIGKTIRMNGDGNYTVGAVVTGFPKQSNYRFDFLARNERMKWNNSNFNIIVELLPGIDVKAFKQKLYKHTVQNDNVDITEMTITPITGIRYQSVEKRDIKFSHIVIFSFAGLLLILCTLFNYLTLFASRLRMRQREFALRTVFGASNRSLFAMLSVEFVVSMIMSLLLGLCFIEIVQPVFIELSGMKIDLLSIYFESLIYIAGIIVIALLTFILTLAAFRRKSLNAAIRSANRRLFRRTSIIVQLTVSIGFAFCTIVILKQMYHLHNIDLGFAFKNRGSVILKTKDMQAVGILNDKIKQIPEITEALDGHNPLLPRQTVVLNDINKWDEMPVGAQSFHIKKSHISEQYLRYYDLKLVEGEMVDDNDEENLVLINESAAKVLGWNISVGKSFYNNADRMYKVKGVIKNILNSAPTEEASPMMYLNNAGRYAERGLWFLYSPAILFKFGDGAWKTCRTKIEEIIKTEYPNLSFEISSTENEYDKFLKSENALLRILSLISLVCMIVCIFGFVSMVSLTCEERRKEIAIRKINGATIKDILDIFFKEYLTLLIVGALIAFPVGYLIMKRWLENYVVQTDMSAWIYLSILLALIMAIVLCVGGKVYRTSRENPAEAVKS